MTRERSHLPRDLALSITLLTAYACLHPFSGWHSIGVGPFDFLTAPFPRWFTWNDIWLNVIGFMPFGFAWTTCFLHRLKPGRLLLLVWLAGTFISLCVETTQNYLPTRVASNIDLSMNSLGTLLGALLALRWGKIFEAGGALPRWRERRFLPGRAGGFGMVLIALWWFSLLNPTSYLFANGDLHALIDGVPEMRLGGEGFQRVETLLAAANTLALGLLAQRAMRRPSPWLIGVIILLGLVVKTVATTVFLSPSQPLHWATPGGLRGLVIGAGVLFVIWAAPVAVRISAAGLSLLFATALVNLAPDNPYWDAGTRLVAEGHVLNFHGATQLLASLWPFIALLWLGLVGPARRERTFAGTID